MGHILRTAIQGNPNIGLYAFVTDRVGFIGHDVPKKIEKAMQEVLQIPFYRVAVGGLPLVGVFLAGNSQHIFLPSIVRDDELTHFQAIAQKEGLQLVILDTMFTALGNNILCNDHGCLINYEMENHVKELLEATLKLPVKKAKIADVDVVGSCAIVTNAAGYVHPEIQGFEQELVEQTLGVRLQKGTVNMGNPYVGSGLLVNSHGFVAGKNSTGIELTTIDETFGFLDEV